MASRWRTYRSYSKRPKRWTPCTKVGQKLTSWHARENIVRPGQRTIIMRKSGGAVKSQLSSPTSPVSTALVETLEPSVLGPLLNEYLSGMTDIVFAHDGTVAKIVGDALHVLFGAPGEQPDHADRAIACALALDDWAQSFRERCHKKGIAFGITRIGAHAGPAFVGNFGGTRFFDYTAYGDTINVAARLETANKQLGTRICVSATLAEAVKDFHGRPIGDLLLRGRAEALRLPSNRFEPNNLMIRHGKSYLDAFAKVRSKPTPNDAATEFDVKNPSWTSVSAKLEARVLALRPPIAPLRRISESNRRTNPSFHTQTRTNSQDFRSDFCLEWTVPDAANPDGLTASSCPLLALTGYAARVAQCPFSGVKRT